jgi:hypothetical protein
MRSSAALYASWWRIPRPPSRRLYRASRERLEQPGLLTFFSGSLFTNCREGVFSETGLTRVRASQKTGFRYWGFPATHISINPRYKMAACEKPTLRGVVHQNPVCLAPLWGTLPSCSGRRLSRTYFLFPPPPFIVRSLTPKRENQKSENHGGGTVTPIRKINPAANDGILTQRK